MVLDIFIPKQSQCLFSLPSSSRPHELHGAFCLLVLLKKVWSVRKPDWFSCHFLKFRILQPEHETVDVVGSFSPTMVHTNGQDLTSVLFEPTSNHMNPPASLITLICHGPSSWKSYAIILSQHSFTVWRIPLLLNDLLLLAEFLWPHILFLSHSVQLNWSPSVTVATSRWGSLTRVMGEAASV